MTHHDAKNVDRAIVNMESIETMTNNQSDEENTEIVVRMTRAQGKMRRRWLESTVQATP